MKKMYSFFLAIVLLSLIGCNEKQNEENEKVLEKPIENEDDTDKNIAETFSVEEDYSKLFELNEDEKLSLIENSKDYIILSLDKIGEDSTIKLSDYYYINKNNTNKVFLFSTDEYVYQIRVTANENEFILVTDGLNMKTGELDKSQSIICKITEQGVNIEKTEDLSIGLDKIDDNGQSFNMQGYITDIKINENKVIMSIRDVKMKEQDVIAFGKTLEKDDLIDVLIIDNNRSGPVINVGDKIMVSCRYTTDKEILYTIGADIRSYEYKDTFVKFETYFDVSNSKVKDKNAQNFILHLKCPNSWDANEGIYSNKNRLSMLATGIIKKIDKNVKLDETAYKYTYRNNDGYDFKDTEHIIGINDKKNSYVLYKSYDSFTGYVVFKFYDEYVLSLSIFDCPDGETMYNIINSVYLEIPE